MLQGGVSLANLQVQPTSYFEYGPSSPSELEGLRRVSLYLLDLMSPYVHHPLPTFSGATFSGAAFSLAWSCSGKLAHGLGRERSLFA